MEVELIKTYDPNESGAIWKLYKLSEPYTYKYWGDEEVTMEYVIVSAVDAMFSGPETYIFPANAEGEITNWGELPGSYRGGYDHEYAISRFVEHMNEGSYADERY